MPDPEKTFKIITRIQLGADIHALPMEYERCDNPIPDSRNWTQRLKLVQRDAGFRVHHSGDFPDMADDRIRNHSQIRHHCLAASEYRTARGRAFLTWCDATGVAFVNWHLLT